MCRFDQAMQMLSSVANRHNDDLFEVFIEMRGHLYLHAGTLLLKLAHDRQQTWRAVSDHTALCYLLAYQVLHAQFSHCSALILNFNCLEGSMQTLYT